MSFNKDAGLKIGSVGACGIRAIQVIYEPLGCYIMGPSSVQSGR